MRSVVLFVTTCLVAGCLGSEERRPDPTPTPWFEPAPINMTLFLKAPNRLAPEPPTKPTADRVAATPMANGFANEDIRGFESEPAPHQAMFGQARIIVYYEVVGPTVDPFVNAANPQSPPRQLVFWLGSKRIYPMSVSTYGDPVLVPGRTYRAEASFTLPHGGWVVPEEEAIGLLVATLVPNMNGYELRFLVDSTSAPSRIELSGTTSDVPLPPTLFGQSSEFTLPGNAGMFTGATAGRAESRLRLPIPVLENDTYLEVRVVFRSNQGGKSDLDFTLYAPDGRRSLSSSTPYQNETIRAFLPQLLEFGAGHFTAEVDAYSGVDTKFSVQMFHASPR